MARNLEGSFLAYLRGISENRNRFPGRKEALEPVMAARRGFLVDPKKTRKST